MDSKIKEIEIESFRIFNSKQTFNFLHDYDVTKVSNLIVMYGPNGYGKTSFSDAIEWSFTGHIKRLESLPEKPERIDKHVLSNRLTKQQGTVKITTNLDDILVAKTTKIKGRRTSDLHEGLIEVSTGVFNTINNNRKVDNAYNKLILDHSKVDNFFKSVTSEHKFETFAPFWDDKNDSKIYSEINNIVNEISKNVTNLKDEEKALKKKMDQVQVENRSMDSINEILTKINNENFYGIRFQKLDDQNLEETEIKILELKKKLSEVSVSDSKINKNYSFIVNNYTSYLEENDNIKKLSLQEDELDKKLKILNYYKMKNVYRKKVIDKIYYVKSKVEKIEKLNFLIEQFDILNNQLDENAKKRKDNEFKLGEIVRNIEIIRNKIEESDFNIKNITNEINKLEKLKKNVQLGYESFNLKTKIIDDTNLKLKKHENEIITNKKELDNFLRQKKDFDIALNIFELKETTDICEALMYNDNLILKKHREVIKSEYDNFLNLLSELDKINTQYSHVKKNNKQVMQLIELGKKMIELNKSDHCPLCNTEFENFESLSRNIGDNSLNLYEKLYIDKIEKINLEISILNNSLECKLNNSKDLIFKESTYLSNTVNKLREKISEKESTIRSLKATILQNEVDKSSIAKNIIFSETTNKKVDKKLIETEIKTIKLKINELYKVHENKLQNHSIFRHNLNDFESKKTEYEKYYLTLQQDGQELKNNPIIKEFKETLNDLNLKLDDNIKKITHDLSDKLIRILSFYERYLIWNEEKLAEYKIIINNQNERESELYNKKLQISSTKKTKILKNKNLISSFKELDPEFAVRNINYYVQETKELEKVLDRNSKLEVYVKEFDLSYNIISNLKKMEQEINEIRTRIETAIKNKSKLEKLNQKIYNSLKTIFEEELDLNFINTIYQMLDPHPSFNKIKLVPRINLKKNLELKIIVSDEDESNDVNPEYYFSAAQINILSLSVFLARALKSTENNPINTIFMDDPIQHFDSLNILSFIDLIRLITEELNTQIIISTHNDTFFELMKKKLDSKHFNSKFIELESFGKLGSDISEY